MVFDERNVNRDRATGRFAEKPTVPAPPAPAPCHTVDDGQARLTRKVDPALQAMSLADIAVRRPVLIATMGDGAQHVGRANVEWGRRSISIPNHVPIGSSTVSVLSYGPSGTPLRVSDRVISLRQGTLQDLSRACYTRRLLEHESGAACATGPDGSCAGVNFQHDETPDARAEHMEHTFRALQDAGCIPQGITAAFHANEPSPDTPWPVTHATYTAPEGAFHAVPRHVAEIRDRARAGDAAAQRALDHLEGEGIVGEQESDLYLAQHAHDSASPLSIPTATFHRMAYVNAQMHASFTMTDSHGREHGGIRARFEER